MKIKLVLLLFLLPIFAIAQGIDFSHSDIQQAIKLAKKNNQLVFVDFTATWCQPCKLMDTQVFQDPIVGEKMNAFFVCVRLDFNEASVKSIASYYGFSRIPLTLCLDTMGNILAKTLGYGDKSRALNQLDYMISLHPKGLKYMAIEKNYKQIPSPSQTVFAAYLTARRAYGLRNSTILTDYWKKMSSEDLEKDSVQTFFADYNTDLKGDVFEYVLKNKSNILIKNKLAALVMFNLQIAIKKEDKFLLSKVK